MQKSTVPLELRRPQMKNQVPKPIQAPKPRKPPSHHVLIQVERLQDAFNTDIVVSINELNGKTVYKVVVGAFSSRSQAQSLQRRMKAAGVNGFIRALKDLT